MQETKAAEAEALSKDPNQIRINELNEALGRLDEQRAVMDPFIYNQQREELVNEIVKLTGGSQYTAYLPPKEEVEKKLAENIEKIASGETKVYVDERFVPGTDEYRQKSSMPIFVQGYDKAGYAIAEAFTGPSEEPRVLKNSGIKREGYTAQVNNETATAFG